MGKQVHVVAHLTAQPDHIAAVREELVKLLQATHREAGCIQYDLLVDDENPAAFTFVERWTDLAALQAHFREPHFLAAGEKLATLLAEPPRIIRLGQVA